MNISGLSGMSYLIFNDQENHKIKNKKVVLMHDVHSGVEYCSNLDNSIDVSDFFKNINISNQILLEESVKGNAKLTDLWPDAKHTQELKKLALNNLENLEVVDIRPYLIPFSWELLETKKEKKLTDKKFKDYLEPLNNFFNKKGSLYKNHVEDKKVLDKFFKDKVCEQLDDLKLLFTHYKENNSKLLKENLLYVFKNNLAILHKLNDILSCLMEWYTILLLFTTDRETSIVHVGLAHSTRIKNILIKRYKFKLEDEQGITHLKNLNLDSKKINSCVFLPKDIHNVLRNNNFNKKFGFYN